MHGSIAHTARRLAGVALVSLAAVAALALVVYFLALPNRVVYGRDLGQWAGEPAPVRDWYANADLTPAAQRRLGFVGCCEKADVVKAKFKPSAKGDAWFYRLADDQPWQPIPSDIIHWDESAPDNKPTLFALAAPFGATPAGTLTCFYPPSGGF